MQNGPLVVKMTASASGAYKAANLGDIVVIVDVIDMSTSLEAAIEAGAKKVFGASSDRANPPVPVNPEKIGFDAGLSAVENKSSVILITEPRSGSYEERKQGCLSVIEGIRRAGADVEDIIPNIGMESAFLADLRDKIVVGVTNSGGVAFDAAYNAGAEVFTATIARTVGKKGEVPAKLCVERIYDYAAENPKDISVVAASANSLEDLLGAQYIMNSLISKGIMKI